jgi:hypothetical protein
MKKVDLIFLSLAKNVEKTLPKFFFFIKKISKEYSVIVCIGEDSSKDNTVKVIEKYKKKNNNLIIIKTKKIKKIKNRILRLATGRQILKNYIIKNNLYSTYVVVSDLDEVIKNGINFESFKKTLKILQKNKKRLFGISCKSKPYYYDMLNLSVPKLYEFDIYKIQSEKKFDFYIKRKKFIYDYQKTITKMNNLLTISSFNGFCTYYYKDYKNSNYIPMHKTEPEHFFFNKKIHKKNNKYILLSNSLILNMPGEHRPYENFIKFFVKKLIKFQIFKN